MTVVTNQTGDASFRPLVALYIPVVTMAAVYGGREALITSAIAAIGYLGPALLSGEHLDNSVQRGLVLISVCVLLVIGTRQTVSKLEQAVQRLRHTMGDARRRSRQVEAVEAVGRTLAARGPESSTLEQVMDLLHATSATATCRSTSSTANLSGSGRSAATTDPIETFDGTVGVIGRVIRNRRPELVIDLVHDPDFVERGRRRHERDLASRSCPTTSCSA